MVRLTESVVELVILAGIGRRVVQAERDWGCQLRETRHPEHGTPDLAQFAGSDLCRQRDWLLWERYVATYDADPHVWQNVRMRRVQERGIEQAGIRAVAHQVLLKW
jgi:hypothetical protein